MEKTQKNILFSEFINSAKYLERILQGIVHFSTLSSNMDVRNECTKLYHELFNYLEKHILNADFGTDEYIDTIGPKEIFLQYQQIINLTQSIIKLNLNSDYSMNTLTGLINLIYRYSYILHNEILANSNLVIDYPRVNLTQMQKNENENCAPLFFLEEGLIQEIQEDKSAKVVSLDFKRSDKYADLIKEGHKQIYEKQYEKAIDFFEMACNLKETAEAYTLLGWAYYLSGEMNTAKNHCLKAIKLDPDFGPPYNDMGSYLLTEGKIDESLKWFALAKNCNNYQHREYPYINAGRAYVNKKEYHKALDEFEQAFSFAPYNEELKQTIERIRKSLNNSNTFKMTTPDEFHPEF